MTEGAECPGDPGAGAGALWDALRALLPRTKEELELELGSGVQGAVRLLLRQATELFYGDRLSECLQASEAILDYAWERLNTGPWQDVDKDWRRVYTFGCLLKALCLCRAPCEASAAAKALRVCDLGLLMGAAILGDILAQAAAVLQAHLPSAQRPARDPSQQPPSPKVDVEQPDLEKFPMFTEAPFLSCVLSPGETLFIPAKYWHYVRALDLSFSVSFWWS
uniref:JmjC domain-containing protein 5 n=1 Tax=Sciurus vulgaris TaxID=55149 RepID=A0A8D2E2I9_SCIVU